MKNSKQNVLVTVAVVMRSLTLLWTKVKISKITLKQTNNDIVDLLSVRQCIAPNAIAFNNKRGHGNHIESNNTTKTSWIYDEKISNRDRFYFRCAVVAVAVMLQHNQWSQNYTLFDSMFAAVADIDGFTTIFGPRHCHQHFRKAKIPYFIRKNNKLN